MKCKICGAAIEAGERECRYCGNSIGVEPMPEKKEKQRFQEAKEDEDTTKLNRADASKFDTFTSTPIITEHPKFKFCRNCGRPLDGRTGKCVVCDVTELSQGLRDKSETFGGAENMARKKKKSNTALKVIILILVLIIIFMVTAVVFFKLLEPEVAQPTEYPGILTTMEAQSEEPTEAATREPQRTVAPTQRAASTPRPTERNGDAGKTSLAYIYPSDKQKLTDKELEDILINYGPERIQYMYFEMYARHGLTFRTGSKLEEHFEYVTGYIPVMPVGSYDEIEDSFNHIEEYNHDLIDDFMGNRNISDDEF